MWRVSEKPSFTHLLNPFPAREGSEHVIASGVTWRTLGAASARARDAGLRVCLKAVILPGDESAVEAEAESTAYLERTVQDIADLRPLHPLPLIGDILRMGSANVDSTHVVFSNMDISVQPHFYTALNELVSNELGPDVPFTISRINIDSALATHPLEELYTAEGTLGRGYDCFVIPHQMIKHLDLGRCCIGAPHFDLLLLMALDILSGHRVKTLNHTRLTFHLGNDIAWAAMIDYIEHNLAESLAAIERMKYQCDIQPGSIFDQLDKRHFHRNATFTSAMMRKIRRMPGSSQLILRAKRALGRQY